MLLVAELYAGKFWRLLGPGSGSLVSLAVTPLASSGAALEIYAQVGVGEDGVGEDVVALPCRCRSIETPSPPLWAMRLRAPLGVPPTAVKSAPLRSSRRLRCCPGRRLPSAVVPMWLPSTLVLVSLEEDEDATGSLAEMTLRAPAAVPPMVLSDAPEMNTPFPPLPKSASRRPWCLCSCPRPCSPWPGSRRS